MAENDRFGPAGCEVTYDAITIDNAERDWCDDEENNALLTDALNGYRFSPGKEKGTFTSTPVNGWQKHFARSLETFALWRQDAATVGRRLDYSQRDRAVI